MRFIYLDESTFSLPDERVGYGVLITDNEVNQVVINNAMMNLINDPDRFIEPQKKMDQRTVDCRFFHASEDSKNAHSHICAAINASISGKFAANFFNNEVLISEGRPDNYVYDLSSKLSIIKGLSTLDPVTFIFEERNGLNIQSIVAWFHKLEKELLMSIYDYPFIPSYFPKVAFQIADKRNPGLQCTDFLLWTVNRHVNGNSTWLRRIITPFRWETNIEERSWGSIDFGLNSELSEPLCYYTLSDFPANPDHEIDNNLLANLFLHAVKVIDCLAYAGVPNTLNHLEAEINEAAQDKKNENTVDYVEKIASAYLKVFDTMNLINEETSTGDKKFLLLSKKYLSLTLRRDLVNGGMTRDWLTRCRREWIRNAPELLDFNFD